MERPTVLPGILLELPLGVDRKADPGEEEASDEERMEREEF